MKKKKGFTLPEMLLACTMLAVITLSSVSVIAMMSGSLFTSQIKRKKSSQRKKKYAGFLCPLGIQIKWLLRASPHSLASQTPSGRTMLGF